jgi:lipopolysaccharide transport system permease protein
MVPMSEELSPDEIIIQPAGSAGMVDFRELWRYRELLWILALRDIAVRYKQTIVGAAWAVIQPLMMMVVFTALFSLIGRYPTESDVPYAITLYCALLPWQLFANTVTQAGESLISNQQLITKVYFPRVIVPMATILAGLIDFVLAFVILILMMVGYHFYGNPLNVSVAILALPLFVLLAVAASLALGLWLSALNALYRDFRYVLPFVIQLGFVASPVLYDMTFLSQRLQENGYSSIWLHLYSLNPMVAVIEGFRWALLGGALPPMGPMLVSIMGVILLMIGGLIYFKRMERLFADRI